MSSKATQTFQNAANTEAPLTKPWPEYVTLQGEERATFIEFLKETYREFMTSMIGKYGAEVPKLSHDNGDMVRMFSYLAEKQAQDPSDQRLQRVLSSGIPINLRGTMSTVLHHAPYCYSEKALTVLLNAGADIEARDVSENTPLITASLWSPSEIPFLLKKGANPNAVNNKGETSLGRLVNEISALSFRDSPADDEERSLCLNVLKTLAADSRIDFSLKDNLTGPLEELNNAIKTWQNDSFHCQSLYEAISILKSAPESQRQVFATSAP